MISDPISINKVEYSNLAIIQELARKIWPPTFSAILSAEQITYMMEMMYDGSVLEKELNRGVAYYLLQYNGENAGYTALERKDDRSFKLHKIYLSTQLQGLGLGKLLLMQMEELAKNMGANWLYLNVNRHNRAVGFYEKMGYQIIASEDIDIGNGFLMNDYIMRKEL